ncbi:DUF4190 domain-containing protein [Mycobacterium camsae]|uniref:DUF4190 domain-containing protein n=1 Tax=Mycobacterium gordonae TaxID=1778 RepID=UPI00197EE17F|nr:DUF4190 domain-containing protein [Mycobacterium gordonae]
MTAPGEGSGEGNDSAPQPTSDQTQAAEQPLPDAPWASPTSSPVVEYPPPLDYPPPVDYPPTQTAWLPGYPPNLAAGVAPPNPPSAYPPPGFQSYGAPPHSFARPTPYPSPPATGPYDSYSGGYYPGPNHVVGYGGMQPGTNTMAIISLVAGAAGIFCFIGSVVGLVCGIVGINQIKQTREDGFGLAVAGIVISAATVLVYFIAVMFGIVAH